MKTRTVLSAATALSVAWCSAAWADEASEKALAQQVAEMRKQIDDLQKRVGDGSNRGGDELEQRIAELEKITKKDSDGLFGYWKNGTKFDSADGAFKMAIIGRIQDDFTWFSSKDEITDKLGPTVGGVEFRRARLGFQGTIYKNVFFKAECDFAGGAVNYADVYMEVKDPFCGPGINVRVGHFDEPMGLDHVTSSKYITFVERSVLETFVPARNNGIMFTGESMENKLQYALGWFRDSNGGGSDVGNTHFGEHNITGRVTGRPWINEDGTEYAHLGLSLSRRHPSDEKVKFTSRPEVHVGPNFVDTGDIAETSDAFMWGLEGAMVFGPMAMQAEWIRDKLNSTGENGGEDHTFDAKSVEISSFLTGENREYDTAGGRFDRIKVKKPFGSAGMGAWQVALRYSTLDLNDGNIEGGELTDWTFGVNWHLNNNTRVQLNLIRGKRTDLPSITAVVMRFQIDF